MLSVSWIKFFILSFCPSFWASQLSFCMGEVRLFVGRADYHRGSEDFNGNDDCHGDALRLGRNVHISSPCASIHHDDCRTPWCCWQKDDSCWWSHNWSWSSRWINSIRRSRNNVREDMPSLRSVCSRQCLSHKPNLYRSVRSILRILGRFYSGSLFSFRIYWGPSFLADSNSAKLTACLMLFVLLTTNRMKGGIQDPGCLKLCW